MHFSGLQLAPQRIYIYSNDLQNLTDKLEAESFHMFTNYQEICNKGQEKFIFLILKFQYMNA
jgi:hypothetical protein